MANINFQIVLDKLKEDVTNLAFSTFKKYKNEATTDALKVVEDMKIDLETWTLELVDGKLDNADFYICGPQAFMDDQWSVLLELGISPSNIHREVFGPESLNHLI